MGYLVLPAIFASIVTSDFHLFRSTHSVISTERFTFRESIRKMAWLTDGVKRTTTFLARHSFAAQKMIEFTPMGHVLNEIVFIK